MSQATGKAAHWVQLGHAYKEFAQFNEAERCYRRAVDVLPSSSNARGQLGLFLLRTNRPEEARHLLLEAFLRDPANQDYWRALIERSVTDVTLEAEWLALAFSHANYRPFKRPLHVRVYRVLARRAARRSDWKRAARHYQAYLAIVSRDAPAWIQLGHAWKEVGEAGSAEIAYRRAIAADPSNAEAHLQIGHLFKDINRRSAARQAYINAWILRPYRDEVATELFSFGISPFETRVLALRSWLPVQFDDEDTIASKGQRGIIPARAMAPSSLSPRARSIFTRLATDKDHHD